MNYFFQLANFQPKPYPLWRRLLVFLAIIISAFLITLLGQTIGFGIFLPLYTSGQIGEALTMEEIFSDGGAGFTAVLTSSQAGIFLITTTIFAAILSFLWIAIFERRGPASLGFQNSISGIFKMIRGALFGMAAIAIISAILYSAGYVRFEAMAMPNSWSKIWPLAILILGWLIQGSSEEIVTRGLLFQTLGSRYGLIAALLTSSLFFTIMHGANPNTSVLFFVNLMFYSIFAGLYCLREGGLWGICGFHGAWNFAQGDLFGFNVSGNELGRDHLMIAIDQGPAIFTGGANGLEGGLTATLILGISAILLFFIKPPKANHDGI